MRLWRKSETAPEGKFLVVRRDGSIPAWPWFVLGARDPAAPAALRAYAAECARLNMDPEFVTDMMVLADEWDQYRKAHGAGDPDAPPHRKDNPEIVAQMRKGSGS